MPDIEIIETTVSDKAAELAPLIRAHRAEVESIDAMRSGDPDWEIYRKLEQSGTLIAVLAYVDGNIVGYSVSILVDSPHSAGRKYVHNDSIYVNPEHRGGMLGVRLINRTERIAHARGASVMVLGAKIGSVLAELLPMIGYAADELLYSREL